MAGLPTLATPLVLRPVPTGFLPVVVRDYVAVHFLTVGLLTLALLWWTGGRPGMGRILDLSGVPLMLAVLVGTLPYFLADEWLTRGGHARRGAYPFTKVLFLVSLALAVALDFEGLFFLVIIVPVILVFFVVHGLFSRWIYRRTGSPLVAGLGNAVPSPGRWP